MLRLGQECVIALFLEYDDAPIINESREANVTSRCGRRESTAFHLKNEVSESDVSDVDCVLHSSND